MTQSIPLLLTVLFLAGSLAMAGTVTITPAEAADGSSQGGGGDEYEAKSVTLEKALEFLSPVKLAKGDRLADLPSGKFDITIKGYAVRQQPAFDALVAEIKKQFKVDVSVAEVEREGYALTVAPDNQLKKSDTEEGLYMSNGKGWTFKAVPVAMVGEFLQKELNVPVTASGPDGVFYTFDLAVSVFKPEQLPEALTKAGFALTKQKVKIKALQATKAE